MPSSATHSPAASHAASAARPEDSVAGAREHLLDRYRLLTRSVLPTRARHERWVVREDHCFQRIVLDHAVGAAWRTVLVGRGPAWRQLSDEQLAAAVAVAEAIERGGAEVLEPLNRQSLAWRGKGR